MLKFIYFIFFLPFLFCSCSAQWYLKKAIFKDPSVITPYRFDTTIIRYDTIYIQGDTLKKKVKAGEKFRAGKYSGSVEVSGDSVDLDIVKDPDTIPRTDTVEVNVAGKAFMVDNPVLLKEIKNMKRSLRLLTIIFVTENLIIVFVLVLVVMGKIKIG